MSLEKKLTEYENKFNKAFPLFEIDPDIEMIDECLEADKLIEELRPDLFDYSEDKDIKY